ncbi:MAG TPA: TonB-dependent receptor [Pyrinomonadaceae bacterium]|nr:TonB-dependent receptor [Pyrinomonadaceae bacterium]
MSLISKTTSRNSLLLLVALLCASAASAQQQLGSIQGQIADDFGARIPGTLVTATGLDGYVKTTTSNAQGRYLLTGLRPGEYRLRATANGFVVYDRADVVIIAGKTLELDITLKVTIEETKVTVDGEQGISVEPENNAGALVFKGTNLDALPDDPDELLAALQALAGPSAGPNGGQIFVDGFSNGSLPPKSSIREIRINSNPFSSEYDRMGFGRIEIFTKPGTDTFRGGAFFNFTDESLNSRNPFASSRPSFQVRQFGGNLSGPLVAKKGSFFADFERREIDDAAVINATVLDSNLSIKSVGQSVATPQRRASFSPRFDYQLNRNNTIVGRYSFIESSTRNAGVGGFSLASRAYDTSNREHSVQLTETAIIDQRVINETRFQFIHRRTSRNGDTIEPGVNVLDAFIGGGSQVGNSFNNEDHWEVNNTTSWSVKNHSLKAGIRLRGVSLDDVSLQNFGGTFTFTGGLGPELDANNQIVVDASGQPVLVQITSIERYRRTILLTQLGFSAAEIVARGGGATQLTLSAGDPEARVSQVDAGVFIQDDWRVRPNFTLNLGLRYETQTNISSRFNFAPRVGFAWSPGAQARNPAKTVVRGGFGVFYDRVGENLTLQATRSSRTLQYIVTDPTILGSFPAIPTVATLTAFAIPQTTWRLASDIKTPYTVQGVFSVERQLPNKFVLTASVISSRALHLLRARNINAPILSTGLQPLGNVGSVFQYETSGRLNQNQLIVNLNNRFNSKVNFFGVYILARAKSDTDGAGSFPAYTYDLSGEYGRSSLDVRHRFIFGGTIVGPIGLSFNPFIVASTGRPFNITTGLDTNGDRLFTERPALAALGADCSAANIVCTSYGNFNLNPDPGEQIILRNAGTGPAFMTVNLRVSKTFSFGGEPPSAAPPGSVGFPGGGGGGPRGLGPPPGGGPGGGGPGSGGPGGPPPPGGNSKRYALAFSIQAQNLLNNTNAGTPIGNLSSALFGVANSSAGGFGPAGGNSMAYNRRVEAQVRFTF